MLVDGRCILAVNAIEVVPQLRNELNGRMNPEFSCGRRSHR